MKFDHLFKPGSIGSLSLKNRIVMPPMGTVQAGPNGEMTDHLIAYYTERAAGGTGLIITEIVCVEPELGKATTCQLRLDDNSFIPGFSRLASSVQKYGAKIFLQLHHAGNQSNSILTGGKPIVAPSPVMNQAVGEQPRELTHAEVKDLVQKFIGAAQRAQMAGVDGVELHGAHGYLINEFLSPYTNQRSDEYGGSFENRMRFVTEIIQGIKKSCGKEFPVCVRFSADEFTGHGIDFDQGKKIAKALEQAGADALNVSSGTYESMATVIEPVMFEEGWRSYLAEEIKKEVTIPVMAVGAIKRPEAAEKILRENKADFIAIGRALLCDPQWANKAKSGSENTITSCIGCMHCLDTIFTFKRIQCAVNARCGRELEFPSPPRDGQGRRVAVIGAGPAGMEAARVLKQREFEPVVYEQRDQPGGELVPGCQPPGKAPIRWYNDSLIQNLNSCGVEIKTNTRAEPGRIKSDIDPYAVILAIGAKAVVPKSIDGTNQDHVFTAIDILNKPDTIKKGSTVTVIGGGSSGCETAQLLAQNGCTVNIVEMLPELAINENAISRAVLLKSLQENSDVEIHTRFKVSAIKKDGVEVEQVESKEKKTLASDAVVLSMGMSPLKEEAAQWQEAFENVYVVGDVVSPSNVAFAVRTAFDAAYTLT
ncbi:MAG: FAD-dependent oxidoreductase [Chitinispirillaceae bacterium]